MLDFELKIRSRDIDTLVREIQKNSPDADIDLIRKAYHCAEREHRDQKRLSGEPYIVHPLEVALILAQMNLDTTTIAAALLHDVVEDTAVGRDRLRNEFGEDIAHLVEGVTKISSLKNRSRATAQAETLRKMLLATARDVRVIIIKLADKLHNMRTLMFQKQEKQRRIAQETMDLYAPLARRLGISKIASELEDLSFHVLEPDAYIAIKDHLQQRHDEIESYIDMVRKELSARLEVTGINAYITGRAKHLYSIHKKMQEQDKAIDDIYDIRAIRVITEEMKDCYGILGVIHTLWSPVAGRFKDYIAVPKSNMYQSLHTTVMGPGGVPLEVQIRTKEMNATAEIGIAAHWYYKETGKSLPHRKEHISLLHDLDKWSENSVGTREFINDFKLDLYDKEIFVFTPKGKIIKLGRGATPVDFAYAIHTEVGHHAQGARVNGKMVPLRTRLESGDIVDVITNPHAKPSESWLKFVKSSNARYKIRSWLRRNDENQNLADGAQKEEPVKKESRQAPVAEVAIPETDRKKLEKMYDRRSGGITLEGSSNVLIRLSQCCQPIPGDEVVGFITRGRGITVHRKDCPSLKKLRQEKERLIDIVWEEESNATYPVKVNVQADDRKDLLKDVADEISHCQTNIIRMEAARERTGDVMLRFVLEVRSTEHLNNILSRIRTVESVTDAFKLNEKVIIK